MFFSQSQDEFRTKELEFVHFRPNTNEVKSDWELMRKVAMLLFTAKCCLFSSMKRQINKCGP